VNGDNEGVRGNWGTLWWRRGLSFCFVFALIHVICLICLANYNLPSKFKICLAKFAYAKTVKWICLANLLAVLLICLANILNLQANLLNF
jgi:hypothetical protein